MRNMRNYKLLSENDIIPNNRYWGIVYYPYPSRNRSPMVDSVFYDKYEGWCGTDKDIAKIIDESIISVLFEYNSERACEIIEGGFTEDEHFNDILGNYDFKLQEKYKKYHINKSESEVKV